LRYVEPQNEIDVNLLKPLVDAFFPHISVVFFERFDGAFARFALVFGNQNDTVIAGARVSAISRLCLLA